MSRNRQEWKTCAREALRGRYSAAILGMLAVAGISFLGSMGASILFRGNSLYALVMSQVFLFILTLIMTVFTAGLSHMYLNMARGYDYSLMDLFYLFRNHPDRVIVAGFVLSLISLVTSIPYYYVNYMTDPGSTMEEQVLWLWKCMGLLLLSLVLEALLTLPFVLVYYILADNREIGGMEALKISARMMKGRKLKFLLLKLSFIPWMLLSVFTLYIGLLWLLPYMDMAAVIFYMDLNGELDQEVMEELPVYEDAPGDDYNSEA